MCCSVLQQQKNYESSQLLQIHHNIIQTLNIKKWQVRVSSILAKVRTMCFTNLESRARVCGMTCGAIDEPSRSSKAIDKCVILNLRDKKFRNCVFLRQKWCFLSLWQNVMICPLCSIDCHSVLSIAFLFYWYIFCSIDSFSFL